MYSLVTRSDVEPHELEGEAPTLYPIGVELKPDRMRPSIWEYEKGEENAYHRQREQEELYVVLEGTVDVTIEHEDERDVVELRQHDCLIVPPESWRQIQAIEDSKVLVVGSPNVKDDGILED